MIDRLLIATAVLTHTALVAAFVLTDGPAGSRVILSFTATHGVHASDLPAIAVWAVGVAALVALWMRRNPR